jgi:hypothetical protein
MTSAPQTARGYVTVTKPNQPFSVFDDLSPVRTVAALFHFTIAFPRLYVTAVEHVSAEYAVCTSCRPFEGYVQPVITIL